MECAVQSFKIFSKNSAIVKDSNANKERVLRNLNNLLDNSPNVVVIHYNGHGDAYIKPEKRNKSGRFICVDDKGRTVRLTIEEILTLIDSKI